ncbi:MAG: histidine kinase, partial [Marmoricola sp.]
MGTPSWRRVDPVDLVIAVAFMLALQAEVWEPGLVGADSSLTHRPLLAALSLVVSVSLAWRRLHPWSVAVAALGAEVAQSRLATPPEGLANLLAMLVVAYSLGRYAPRSARYAGSALVAAVAFGVRGDLADNLFVLVVLGAAWGAGVLIGRRTEDIGTLELRRLEATRNGAEEERLRIARELHDVVAHRVSMMVVQSQLADTLLDHDPRGARRAINAVEEAGRDALTELRSVLGLLHHEGEAAQSPVDTDLARLGDLVDDARSAGLPATLRVTGVPRPVPPVVAMAAFRIVQESLTNVVKHAGSSAAMVELEYAPSSVEVQVTDDGPVVDGH